MFFNMLEERLGDKTFREGIRRFYTDNAFKRASWADMQAAFETASGEPLKWLL